MLPLLNLMEGGGKYIQWVKAACGLVGRPAGAPRAPLRPATPPEQSQLRAALRQIPETQRAASHPQRRDAAQARSSHRTKGH
jgi:4-hydroxy-tetrahydrodipicolinate synthase